MVRGTIFLYVYHNYMIVLKKSALGRKHRFIEIQNILFMYNLSFMYKLYVHNFYVLYSCVFSIFHIIVVCGIEIWIHVSGMLLRF